MRVRVYRNLHKQTYSIQTMTPSGWRVSSHKDSLILKDVTFKVYERGRQLVLKSRHKNVHAYVEGTLIDDACGGQGERISYNPYRASTFTDATGKAIMFTEAVVMNQDGLYLYSLRRKREK